MAAQTDYINAIPQGFPGMVVNGETSNRISRTIEDVGGIGFGKAAFRGTGDRGITATPTANKFMGISLIDPALQIQPGGTVDTFPRYSSVPLIDKGVVFVNASVAVNDGEQVYVTSGGLFTNSSSGNVLLPNAVFDATIGAAGLVPVRLRASSVG